MQCEILGHTDEDIGVEITDENGIEHIVEVEWDGGIRHFVDEYPDKPEDRTKEEQRIMTQAEHRARYAAQKEFPDADILPPSQLPEVVERAIEATQQMDAERFAEEFWELYDAIENTEDHLPEGVSAEQASCIAFAFTITPDNEYGESGDVDILYRGNDGEVRSTAQPDGFLENDAYAMLYFSPGGFPYEVEYPDEFFQEVQANLVFQVRDLLERMGRDIPETYQVKGYRVYPVPWHDVDAVLD